MVRGKPTDASAPKRPLSGYFLFAGEQRAALKKSEPSLSITEVAQKIGQSWSGLDEAKKSVFNGKADKAKAVYAKKLAAYKKTPKYAKFQAELKEWKQTQKSKPFKKDQNKPKRGLSAYIIFVNEQRPALTKKGLALTEVSKEAANMWNKLNDSEKAVFQKKADKSKAAADKAMAKYMKSNTYKAYMAEKAAYEAKQKEAKKAAKQAAKEASKPKKAEKKAKKVTKKVSKKAAKKAGKAKKVAKKALKKKAAKKARK